jgi:N6-L-threonylcarbamoyladenine synthase
VRYFLQKHSTDPVAQLNVKDLCASVQAAIVETLVAKTLRAAKECGVECVTVSGGVSCNRGLREALGQACRAHGLRLRLADAAFCTDNAAMIGVLAELKLRQGMPPSPPDTDVAPNWPLAEASGPGLKDYLVP